MTIQVVGGIIK